jgi:hypothetical protein
MLLETPAVVSHWSGNADFCNNENAMLVSGDVVSLDQDHGPYKKGASWFDPDIQVAASHLMELYLKAEKIAALAQASRAYITEELSPSVVGKLIERRVNAIQAED